MGRWVCQTCWVFQERLSIRSIRGLQVSRSISCFLDKFHNTFHHVSPFELLRNTSKGESSSWPHSWWELLHQGVPVTSSILSPVCCSVSSSDDSWNCKIWHWFRALLACLGHFWNGMTFACGRFGQFPVPRLYQPIKQTAGKVNDAFLMWPEPSPGYLHTAHTHTDTLHYIALHCITLQYITLRYIALHCITLHYIALHCNTLHYIAIHCITLHYIALHCITLHCIALPFITLHYITYINYIIQITCQSFSIKGGRLCPAHHYPAER